MKPIVLVRSSPNAHDVAGRLCASLVKVAELSDWTHDWFGLPAGKLEGLLEAIERAHYGVIVLDSKDVMEQFNDTLPMTSEEIALELGLIIGRFSQERCFILLPEESIIAVDRLKLLKVTVMTYSWPADSDLLLDLCNRITGYFTSPVDVTSAVAR